LWLLQRIDASIFALNTLITPVIAVIVGATIGAEHFDARALLGAALVILGVWLALRRPSQSAAHARDAVEAPRLDERIQADTS
jgi:drug/metabolite transporter (DMT)-like permease